MRIAILDDDLHACKRLSLLLEKTLPNKDEIAFWTNPVKAIEQINTYQPKLIFLDVEMPHLDGFSTLKALRKNGFTGRAIFTTAYDQYILDALRAEALDFLLKPIDPKELVQAIDRFKLKSNQPKIDFSHLSNKGLTPREIEICALIFKGFNSQEIGDQLFISKTTVDKHRSNILHKTGCKNTTELFTLL